MSTIADMKIKIGADSSGLQKGLKDAKTAINDTFDTSPITAMTNAINGTTSSMGGFVQMASKYATLIAGGFGLVSIIDSAAKAGTATENLTRKLGMTTKEVGLLKKTLQLTGGDIEMASKAIMKLDKTFSSAGEAGDKMRTLLNGMGVSLTDQEGKLLPINEQLKNLSEGYKRATAAGYGQEFIMHTLGAKGLALVDTLNRYTEAQEKAAQVEGIGLSVEELDKLNMDIQVLQMQATQLGLAFGQAFLPIAQDVLPEMMSGLKEAAIFLRENKDGLAELIQVGTEGLVVYKTLSAAASGYAKISATIAALSAEQQIANEVKLTAFQTKAINTRVRAIEAAALKSIKAYERELAAQNLTETEKTLKVQQETIRRVALAEQEAAAVKVAMTQQMLALNAQDAAYVANAAASERATAVKVAGETAAKMATVETTLAIEGQTAANIANGVAAEGSAMKGITMMGKLGPAVKGVTSLLFAMAGGWLGVAAAISIAAYQFYKWQMQLKEEREANTYTTNEGEAYTYKKGKWWTTGYNGGGHYLEDQSKIDVLEGKRMAAEVQRENEAKKGVTDAADSIKQQQEEWNRQYNQIMASAGENTKALKENTKATERQTEYVIEHPIGLDAVGVAGDNYSEGQHWMGNHTDDPTIQCDSWTGDVYAQAGIESIGGQSTQGLIRDDAFRAAGAYHSANSGYQPQPGDLVDWEGHVGIYMGNGLVRSRQSTAGVHTATMAEAESYFGPVQGYGSIAEATGNRMSTKKLTGTAAEAAAAREAQSAAQKAQQATREANSMLESLGRTIESVNATEYQKEMIRLEADIQQKRQQISKYEADGADAAIISRLREEMDLYAETLTGEAAKKQREALDDYKREAMKVNAEVAHDYEAQAQAQYEIAVANAQKEFDEKKKTIAQSEDDIEALQALQDKYYASIEAAEQELRRNKKKAHQEYINYLKEEGDLMAIVYDSRNNAGAWEEDSRVNGMKSLSEQYAQYAANIHMSFEEQIASVSSAAYDDLSSSLHDFIMHTKSAGDVFNSFVNTILSSIAKIAAQQLASKWISGILGGIFGGGIGGGVNAGFGEATFGFMGANAEGGYIEGPGTDTSDSIPSWLSNGEFVVNARATRRYRGLLEKINSFATGGIVTAPTLASPSFGGSYGGDSLSGGGGSGANIQINLVNESNHELEAEETGKAWDGEKWVVGVVLKAVATNQNGIRSLIKGVAST